MTTEHLIRTDYLGAIYDPDKFAIVAKNTVERAREVMKANPYMAIAFTGSSGAAVGYIISAQLGVPMICVRKANDNSHYSRIYGQVEGCLSVRTYLFVDDFIGSGKTFENVVLAIESVAPRAVCIGALLYGSSTYDQQRTVLIRDERRLITVYSSYKQDCFSLCGAQRRLPFYPWNENREL